MNVESLRKLIKEEVEYALDESRLFESTEQHKRIKQLAKAAYDLGADPWRDQLPDEFIVLADALEDIGRTDLSDAVMQRNSFDDDEDQEKRRRQVLKRLINTPTVSWDLPATWEEYQKWVLGLMKKAGAPAALVRIAADGALPVSEVMYGSWQNVAQELKDMEKSKDKTGTTEEEYVREYKHVVSFYLHDIVDQAYADYNDYDSSTRDHTVTLPSAGSLSNRVMALAWGRKKLPKLDVPAQKSSLSDVGLTLKKLISLLKKEGYAVVKSKGRFVSKTQVSVMVKGSNKTLDGLKKFMTRALSVPLGDRQYMPSNHPDEWVCQDKATESCIEIMPDSEDDDETFQAIVEVSYVPR